MPDDNVTELNPDAAAAGDEAVASGGGMSVDFGVVGGLILGVCAMVGGMILEGTSPAAYWAISAAVIVFGGTFGAQLVASGIQTIKTIPSQLKRAITYRPVDKPESIRTLVKFAEKARREGLLVLEDDLQETDDEFLRRGVQLVVDGTDPELVKEILEIEVDALASENGKKAKVWAQLAGYSPTMGIIGTVMGLVNVLANLSDPGSLGPMIAVAFVATFYGVMFANLWYMPISMKLMSASDDEVSGRELVLEGILAIQSGDNPRIVEEKLVAFLDSTSKRTYMQAKHAASASDDLDLAA